ncbi:MAG: TonB-dependent receptor [Prevotellaceae bacterium]|jgi:TonB-linked SusC/RagA family outer membrane protein|nr:TonB-dependent receptor [Prevotellaceae bacterium]
MKNIVLLLLMCLYSLTVQAQGKITGTVVDELGEPMIGVSVIVKGTSVGVFTDTNGKYSINIPKTDNNVLVFALMGYVSQEISINGQTVIDITMKEDATMLEELVVVGLGTQKKISVVGAITSVNVSEIQTPATSITNMMGGRMPGVISTLASGEPGKNISEFWIRGIGTFGANASALVLIDGLEGDINSIDPADVESFSILKDASATAVYGVRGANGVVLVTTKHGVSGRLKMTARANWTFSYLNRMPEYLRAYDYATLANEARVVRGDEPIYTNMEMDLIQYNLDPDLYPDVDWQKEIMKRNGFQQTYYVSGQGGGEIAKYFLSLGHSNENAAYKTDPNTPYGKNSNVGYNTYNFRGNLDINLTKMTSVFFGMEGYLTMTDAPGVANTDALWNAQSQLTPLTIPTKYSTGQLPAFGPNDAYSPYVMLNYTGMMSNQTMTGKATLALKHDFSDFIKGLKLKLQGAYDLKSYFEEYRRVLPEMYAATGRNVRGELQLAKRVEEVKAQYGYNTRQFRKYHFEGNLNYETTINNDHNVSALVYYYMSDQKDTYDINNSGINLSMAAIPKRYQGISSRLSYGFRNTYMIDVNFGYTGSENFQPGRQFGFFPSIAGGWVPSNYDFIRKNLPWIDFFKIRASYGSVGNDRLVGWRFPYLTLVNETASTGWSGSYWGSTGIRETAIGADNLMWEKSLKSDIGFEGRLFKDKISFVIDFFNDQRDGIFQQRAQIPDYAGLLAMPYGNVGKMRSWGSDGNISFMQSLSEHLSFTLRGNFSYSRNEIQNWEQTIPKYGYQEYNGYPNGAIRGYIALGLFRDEQDVASSPVQSFGTVCLPGDIKYKDVNGDGKIDTDDQVPLSNSTFPNLMYGFGFEVKYRNLTLGVLFKGTGKTDFFHVGQDIGSGNINGMGYVPFHGEQTGNVLSIIKDPATRWIPRDYAIAHGIDPALAENPNARFPRLTYGYNANNSQLSTWWKGDARYLRLQEVTLNYNLKNDFVKKIGLTSIDLQFVGSNLYVWDRVKLWDPEQANKNGRVYPIPSRYTLQLYLNF